MLTVYVNGKRVVADVHNLNIEEGWVDILDPSVVQDNLDMSLEPIVDPFLPQEIDLPLKRLYGKIEVKGTE